MVRSSDPVRFNLARDRAEETGWVKRSWRRCSCVLMSVLRTLALAFLVAVVSVLTLARPSFAAVQNDDRESATVIAARRARVDARVAELARIADELLSGARAGLPGASS